MKNLETIYEDQLKRYRSDYKNFIVNEMSLKMDDDQDILNKNNGFITQGQYYTTQGNYNGSEVINNINLDVYSVGNMTCFVNSQKWAVALIEFNDIDDGIIMKYINVHKSYKNLMEHIFVEYLLPKYRKIISDNIHTEQGFSFYKKMCFLQNTYNYKFYLKDDNRTVRITDCSKLDSTFGYDSEMSEYRYMIVQ